MPVSRILVVRLGAMGDVVHALPAVATLKRSFPAARVTWAIHPRWRVLLAGNPSVDEIIEVDRRQWPLLRAGVGQLIAGRFDMAVDFQGLIQSAVLTRFSSAKLRVGFHRTQARESLAGWLYNLPVRTQAEHVVEKNLELAAAAGAQSRTTVAWLPKGKPEGTLPATPYVLASPLAGWKSKQWPLEHYSELAKLLRDELNLPLIVNGAPEAEAKLRAIAGAQVHLSSVEGLLNATWNAEAVVGVDSGPLHIGAAMGKPGVAIFGPTDPVRNGPYGGTIEVLRDPLAATTYRRGESIDPSMRIITPEAVFATLKGQLT